MREKEKERERGWGGERKREQEGKREGEGSTFHQIPGNNYRRDNRIGKSFGTNLIITDSDKNKQKMLKLVSKDLIRNRMLT